jgi:predicted alpha/beta-fold hydrolase
MRRKAAAWPGAFDLTPLDGIRTIRAFDEVYTAPHHGFAGASDYYFKASAMRVVDRIRVPALVMAAEDDPFVPAGQFRAPAFPANRSVTVRIETHGGHCGFIGATANGGDPYWAEAAAVRFLAAAIEG